VRHFMKVTYNFERHSHRRSLCEGTKIGNTVWFVLYRHVRESGYNLQRLSLWPD